MSVPEDLGAAYRVRCQEEGAELSVFLEEARGRWPTEALRALVDRVEEDMLENVALMLRARPDLEELAEARARDIEAAMQRLRDGL